MDEKKEQIIERLSRISDKLLLYANLSREYERTPHNYGLKEAFGIDTRLNHMEIHMLDAINRRPGISAQELATIFSRTKGSVSQNMKAIAGEGLIIKKENPRNGRINNLYPTELGRVACENHTRREMEIYQRMLPSFEGFAAEDFDKFLQILDIMMEWIRDDLRAEKNPSSNG